MDRSIYEVDEEVDDIRINMYLKGSDRFDTLRKVIKKIELYILRKGPH